MGVVAQQDDDIVIEHARRASMLWNRRHESVRSRLDSLGDRVRLDDELRAHLDGLFAAGDQGWVLAGMTHPSSDAGRMFTLVVLAGLHKDRDYVEDLIARCDLETLGPAIISALGWLRPRLVRSLLSDWLDYDRPQWRLLSLAGHVAHRIDPRAAIDRGLLDDDPGVRRQAIRACGVFGRRALAPMLRALHDDASEDAGFVVARSLLQLGELDGPERLWEHALDGGDLGEHAAELAVRVVPVPLADRWLRNAACSPALGRVVVVAAARTGSPTCVPYLLDALEDPERAALAGYGLKTMLGLDIEGEGLETEPQSDNDLDLPYPDVEGVQAWWEDTRPIFERGSRWFLGRPGLRGARRALRRGSQRLRALAAHDLHLGCDGQAVPFEVDAPAWRQQRRL